MCLFFSCRATGKCQFDTFSAAAETIPDFKKKEITSVTVCRFQLVLNHVATSLQIITSTKPIVNIPKIKQLKSFISSTPHFEQMVCLWSLRSYTFIRNLTGANQKTLCLLSSCDFSPDGAVFATAAFSGSSWWIDLWDPYTAEKLATLA